MKILLVEDDPRSTAVLTEALLAHRYMVESVPDGAAALEMAQTYDYDLVLLDVMLPGLDGVSVCRRLRSQDYQGLILMMTARSAGSDRVAGLDAGADDYMAKPIDIPELLARIRALNRRRGNTLPPIIRWGELQLDPNAGLVTYQGKPLHLTPKEYGLLELFLLNPTRVYNRSGIIDLLWPSGEFPGEETVTAHMKGLRQKLKAIGAPDVIETVYGLGYRLKAAPQEPEPVEPEVAPEVRVTRSLQQIWERTQPELEKQLSALHKANAAYASQQLTSEIQQQARQEAHKLAGSLGLFGFARGSELARSIEELLTSPLSAEGAAQFSTLLGELQQNVKQPPQPAHKIPSPAAMKVLMVDDDRLLVEKIQATAIAAGMEVRVAMSLNNARREIASSPPDVILLDLTFADTDENGLELVQELSDRQSGIAIVIFTANTSLQCRIQLARLRSHVFLQKPALPEQVIAALQQALTQSAAAQPKILVIDDDPHILALLEVELKRHGFQPKMLADPKQFWTVLQEVNPDLMILDIEMPDFNGLELCQVVRHDSRWGKLPIVVLTAHSEPQLLQQIYAAGADDCIHKSVEETELITRVRHRLNRRPIDGLTM